MRRFFLIILLANSFFSFADYYKPEDPEYQKAKNSGEEKAVSEVKPLQQKNTELYYLIQKLIQNINEQGQEYKKLDKELRKEKEEMPKEFYKNNFDSDSEGPSSEGAPIEASVANTFKREGILYEGWLLKKQGGKKKWINRWVVLTRERLAYYNNEGKEICINQVPKSKFKLITLRHEETLDINMSGPSPRMWHFKAQDEKTKNFWLGKFKIFKPSKEESARRKSEAEKLEKEEELERIEKAAMISSLEKEIEKIIKNEEFYIEEINKIRNSIGRLKGGLSNFMRVFFNYSEEE